MRSPLRSPAGAQAAGGVAAWGGTGSGLINPSGGTLRVWNQQNYGEDLIYGPNGGLLYYWYARQGLAASTFTVTIASPAVATLAFVPRAGMGLRFTTTGALPTGLSVGTTYYVSNVINNTCNLTATFGGAAITTTGTQSGVHSVSQRGIPLSTLPGASDTPLFCNVLQTSDTTRFVFAMGTNDYGSTTVDPMLVRWSDQENAGVWTPAITNQSGSQRLSNGWKIVTSLFARQELLVWTTSALYSFQYLGPPYVWGSQLMGDNLSIISIRAAALASSVAYWMGVDKFYAYNGRVNTLRCDLRQYIFGDINMDQAEQFFAGTNEGFSEVWWFYCSASSDAIDRYVIYNYAEDVWYHGALARTAWLDTPLREFPTAATYSQNIVSHEVGTDDNETGTPVGMNSSITSSEFDIGDGHNFGFVWRMLPDMTFRGSTAAAPTATLTMNTLQNSGSGYTTPGSQGGSDNAAVVQTVAVPIEKYTGEVYVRVRGRQMAFTVSANQVGTTWQLGAPRIDVRGDGRKS